MRYGSKLAILTWLCTSGLALAAETAAPAPKLELHACTGIPGLPPEARCGVELRTQWGAGSTQWGERSTRWNERLMRPCLNGAFPICCGRPLA